MPILNVFNPRQGQRAQQLNEMIKNEGWQPLSVPTFVIETGCDESRFIEEIPLLLDSDKDLTRLCFIFISTNAVQFFYKLCQTHLSTSQLQVLISIPCFAVGKATRKQLVDYHFDHVLVPKQENAEGMLADPKIEQFEQFVIIKGEGGRDILELNLAKSANLLHCYSLYRRTWLKLNHCQLKEILTADVWLITSGEMLSHIMESIDAYIEADLSHITVLLPSKRVEMIAKQWEIPNVININSARNEDLVAQIKRLSR